MTSRSLSLLGVMLLGLRATAGCGDDVVIGFDLPRDGGGGTTPDDGSAAASGAGPCEPARCGNRGYACGDCLDNDGDGAIDAADSECLGPCDDTEDSYNLGIEAGSGSCREDCAYDRDSGPGNDGCSFSHSCDVLSVAPDYPPTGRASCEYAPDAECTELSSAQAPTCLETCLPLTPNGCDCFGCCELPARSGRYVWVGAALDEGTACSEDLLGDASACHPCTPVPSCLNPCEDCEICAGNAPLAPACMTGTVACDLGRAACGPESPTCTSGSYCITGCCVPEPR